MANGITKHACFMRRLPDTVSDFAVLESRVSAVFHRGAFHLHLPPLPEGEILFDVTSHQSHHLHCVQLPIVEPYSRILLDVHGRGV